MAEQRRSGRSKGVPHHPLAEALASDPSKPPERATKLFGFPGPAADDKSTRLWLDPDLVSHVEVPNDAIIHSQTLDNDQGTILWVDPSATVTHSTTQSQDVQAEFLGGSIAAGNLGSGVPRDLDWPSKLGTGPTRTFPCPPQEMTVNWGPCLWTDFPCRVSVNIPCATRDIPCPSVNASCPSEPRICLTRDPRICEPVLSSLRCPSRAVPCPPPVRSIPECFPPPRSIPLCENPWETITETPVNPGDVINRVGPIDPLQRFG